MKKHNLIKQNIFVKLSQCLLTLVFPTMPKQASVGGLANWRHLPSEL